jgi:hypothetical protein
VPPAAIILLDNGEENPCTVHGKWSAGDPRLALLLVSSLWLANSDYSSPALEAGGGNDAGGGDSDDSSGGRSLVDMLVDTIKRCAVAQWLVPVNRGHFESDRRRLVQVI